MIRWPFYLAELLAFGAALAFTIVMQRRRLPGYRDVFIVQVPIVLKTLWALVLSWLALQTGGDPAPTHALATISQSLTFLMGLCLAMLFAKRVSGHE